MEDNEPVRKFLVIWIEHFKKFDVVDSAMDGETALEMFEPGKYDFVVMDLGLVCMTGVDACLKMRELDEEVVIVALTGHSELVEENDLSLAGFDKCYAKPMGYEDLLTAIESLDFYELKP